MIIANSATVRCVFNGIMYRPASWQASDVSISVLPLSTSTPTLSPTDAPTERNRCTSWCASPASSAYVRGPSGLSTIASASG